MPSGELLAVWTEGRGDFFDEIKYVYYATSSDGGGTFTSPRPLPGTRGAVAAVVQVGDRTALLAQYQKLPESRPKTLLFFAENGTSFGSNERITTTGSNNHLNQNSIAVSGQIVAIAWSETSARPGTYHAVYLAVSSDGGRTFATPRVVAPGLVADPPALAVSPSGTVDVVFTSPSANPAERAIVLERVDNAF